MLNVLIFYKFCIDSCTWKSLLTPKYLAVVTNYYALNQPQPKPNNNDYFSRKVYLISQVKETTNDLLLVKHILQN